MKKLLLAALLCSTGSIALADDIIVFRSGEVVRGKVEEVSRRTVKYKNANNPDGPSYTIDSRELLSIQYENGTLDLLSDPIKVEKEKEETTNENAPLKFCPQVAAVLATQGSSSMTGGGGVEFIANFKVNDRFKIGPGIGMMGHNFSEDIGKYKDVSTFEIPVFLNLQYNLSEKSVIPYLQGQIGYNFGTVDCFSYHDDEDQHMNLFVKVGAGINFNLKRGALFVDLGCKLSQWTLDSTPIYGEFTIGYCFRHH